MPAIKGKRKNGQTKKSIPLKRLKKAFIAAYSETGNISHSCEIVGVPREWYYQQIKKDETFKEALLQAEEEAAERLEKEARRRAIEGVEKPVYQGGKKVGCIREYSDTLLIFLLKGAKPEKYKERGRFEHVGSGGGPIEVKKYDRLSDEELDKLITEKLAALEKTGLTDPD